MNSRVSIKHLRKKSDVVLIGEVCNGFNIQIPADQNGDCLSASTWYHVDFVNIVGHVKTSACIEHYVKHNILPISQRDFELLYSMGVNRFPRDKVIFSFTQENIENFNGVTVWTGIPTEHNQVPSVWESKKDHWYFFMSDTTFEWHSVHSLLCASRL